MTDHITIRPLSGTWVVRTGDAVIGESTNALELREGAYDPVIYIPRADIAMALLERSVRRTTCPHKGDASHYSIVAAHGTIPDAAWSYEAPLPGVQQIAGHLAFYPDKATLERI